LPVQAAAAAEIRTRDRATELRTSKGALTFAAATAAELLALRKLLALGAAGLLLSQGMTIAVAAACRGLTLLTGEPAAMAVTASLLRKGTGLLVTTAMTVTTAAAGEGAGLLVSTAKSAGLLTTAVTVASTATGEHRAEAAAAAMTMAAAGTASATYKRGSTAATVAVTTATSAAVAMMTTATATARRAAAVGITTATATATGMRIASAATMAASGPCACRGCNRQSSDARGENQPGHWNISFRTEETVRSTHRSIL
jgi:hypothetical protein